MATANDTPAALVDLARIDKELSGRFLTSAQPALSRANALPRPNAAEGLAVLNDVSPDLILSIRYRRILKNAAIAIPKHGVINLHSGLLPDYRGVMATFWAMLNGESEIGCTLHRIVDSGIDTGPVLGVSRMRTATNKSYLANVLGLYSDGCEMIERAIKATTRGKALPGTHQIEVGGRYYSTPDADAIQRFFDKNLTLANGTELESRFSEKKGDR